MRPMELLGIWHPGPFEIIALLVIALLLFGKRLPEVARSMGKGVVEFKKGLKGIEDDVDSAEYQGSRKQASAEDKSPSNPNVAT